MMNWLYIKSYHWYCSSVTCSNNSDRIVTNGAPSDLIAANERDKESKEPKKTTV